MYQVKTSKIDLFPYANLYKVYVTDHTLANRLNKLLKYYKGYTFSEGEEAVFQFNPKLLINVQAVLSL